MTFALAQLNFHIGNFSANGQKISEAISKAKNQGADVVIFPELAISGYPPRDFLNFDHFISSCHDVVEQLAAQCTDIIAIVGAPVKNNNEKGKKLHNAAFVLRDGKIDSVHHKMLLPNYDVFEEYRYFEPGKEVLPIDINGATWALTICEDIWDYQPKSIYTQHPLDVLEEKGGFDGIINIASSPFSNKQRSLRQSTLKNVHNRYQVPILYVNQVGAQTELIFDGGSSVIDDSGTLMEGPYFSEELLLWDASKKSTDWALSKAPNPKALVADAICTGISDYFKKLGFNKAILGLSGGIDSAVTLALACKALGPENVLAVLMPSEFSSDHSVDDSEDMVNRLGCPSYKIPIQPLYQSFLKQLETPFEGTDFGLAEENLQARIRGNLLMAISNKKGQILLNTSNKSEIAVGFGTIYGDMCGGLSVIGDLYKQEVFDLARFLNEESEIIPVNIINKPPSAELRPGQLDSDRLPDYDQLDAILYHYIELEQDANQIQKNLPHISEETIRQTVRLVNINEYKRHQTPPILRVSTKAFGQGRRIPIVAKYLDTY